MSTKSIPELKSATQLAAEIKGEVSDEIEENVDPKDSEKYTFDFNYKDARGKIWSGKFTNRILTVGQKRQLKVLKAQLSGEVSVQALDNDVWLINEWIAHLSISLEQNKIFPSWAKDFEALYDKRIIGALYEEVDSHESTFHRRESPVISSESANEDGAG